MEYSVFVKVNSFKTIIVQKVGNDETTDPLRVLLRYLFHPIVCLQVEVGDGLHGKIVADDSLIEVQQYLIVSIIFFFPFQREHLITSTIVSQEIPGHIPYFGVFLQDTYQAAMIDLCRQPNDDSEFWYV